MSFKIRFAPVALTAALLAGGLGAVASAQPPPDAPTPPPPHERGLPPQLAALNLTDAQKDKIKSLHESQKAAHEQQHEAERALDKSLWALTPAAPNYAQEVDRIATQLGQAHAQHIRDMAQQRAQIWAILTPAQQAQLAAMPQPAFDGPHHGPHHGPGPEAGPRG